MVFYLAALLILICAGIQIGGVGQFNRGYLDKKNTVAINGIFVILVVFSHYAQYADFGGVIDAPYLLLRKHLHQMVVATFLFYSGFGMMEQIKKKGNAYVNSLPKKAGKLLFRFDVAVLLFLVMQYAFGNTYKLRRIVLSLIGWKAVGNSNWYIFDILVLYVLMFAAFGAAALFRGTGAGPELKAAPGQAATKAAKAPVAGAKSGSGQAKGPRLFSKHPNLPGLVLFFILTLAFIYAMMKTDKGTRWYNTVILLPVGCFYSEFREEIERLIMKNDVTYYLTLLLTFAVYCFSYLHRHSYGIEGYTVWALAFIAMVVLVTMKVRIYNPVLEWFGKHVFSIYILQRIPMMVLNHFGFVDAHKYLVLAAVFALTIPFALAFEKVTDAALKQLDKTGAPKASA